MSWNNCDSILNGYRDIQLLSVFFCDTLYRLQNQTIFSYAPTAGGGVGRVKLTKGNMVCIFSINYLQHNVWLGCCWRIPLYSNLSIWYANLYRIYIEWQCIIFIKPSSYLEFVNNHIVSNNFEISDKLLEMF